jgi:hypothetical protein
MVLASGYDEEKDRFVGVLRSAPADAQGVGEDGVEGGRFDDGVDFAAAEADAGGVWISRSVTIIGEKDAGLDAITLT